MSAAYWRLRPSWRRRQMPRSGRIRHDQSLPRRRNHRGGAASHIDPSIEPSDARGDAGQETKLRHIWFSVGCRQESVTMSKLLLCATVLTATAAAGTLVLLAGAAAAGGAAIVCCCRSRQRTGWI